MAHMRVNHPSDVMSEGDELDVYILAVDRERERVSLSRKVLKSLGDCRRKVPGR